MDGICRGEEKMAQGFVTRWNRHVDKVVAEGDVALFDAEGKVKLNAHWKKEKDQ